MKPKPRLFRRLDYRAGSDRGIDILAERDGRKFLLQCKGDGAPVGVAAVQRVFAAMGNVGRIPLSAFR
jgi:HJR/Mrr/RecB family endonuclease